MQLINSEAMTSQTDYQISNLCSDFLSSIVCHTLKKNHNFLISYPTLLKLVSLCFSCVSASMEEQVIFGVDLAIKESIRSVFANI